MSDSFEPTTPKKSLASIVENDCFSVEIEEKVAPSTKISHEEFQVNDEAQRRILELEAELQHTRENLQALIEELETTNEELYTINSEYQSKIQELTRLNNDRVHQRTQVLACFSNRLKQLHRISTGSYPDLTHLFAEYLQTGCQMLDMSTGIISEVEGYSYKVIAVESPLDIAVESQLDYRDTYCAEVVNGLKTVTCPHVGIEWMQNHPLYISFKLESFISTPIFVNDRLYGTLHFSDTSSKNSFSQEEREIVELMAKDIGQSIGAVKVKAALEENKARFRNTFEQAAVGIAHVSSAGKFMLVNQKLCQILGYEREALEQLTFQAITHPDDAQRDEEIRQQLLKGEIDSHTREKRYFHATGSTVWVNLTVSSIADSSGEPEYFVCVVEDIGDRKRAEAVIEQNKLDREKLKLVNQTKDAFIAHMSHELRTPLNSILGFSSILQNINTLTPKEHQAIDLIYQSGQHLLNLINDILDFSKINVQKLQLEPQSFDFYRFLADIGTLFRLRAQQKGLIFISEISPSLPLVINADITKLRQVLYNLLSNAIKFTQTGSVTFKVTPISQITKLEAEKFSGVKVRFAIEDTGIGIREEQFTMIFSPFGQLSGNVGNHQGTGLGLTICQEIVKLMGGKIELTSQLSVGSKFWFDLEFEIRESGFVAAVEAPACQLNYRLNTPKKILVVDDNDANRTLLVNYLEPLGFIVAEASNGEAGLSIARTFLPDAVLVDLIMPVMDGQEMITQIGQRPNLQNTIIIIISASGNPANSFVSDLKVNYQGFLSKPVDLEQLLSMLETHLNLDWQLKPSVRSTPADISALKLPPQQQLEELLTLVNLGNLEEIERLLQAIELSDRQYTIFARKVRDLVDSCQQNQLETMLKTAIK